MENDMEIPQKLRAELPCDLDIPLLDIYLKTVKTKRQMHPYVHCSNIYNSQDTETT